MSLGAMGGSIGLGLATIAVLAKLYSDARSAHAEYVESGGEPAAEAPRGAFSFAYTLMAVGAVVVAAGVMLVLTDPWEAASAPTIKRPAREPGILVHERAGVAVYLEPTSKAIITVAMVDPTRKAM